MSRASREHPDFLVTIETFDAELCQNVTVDIGYGYKHRKGGTRIFLAEDARSKQLLYEATTLDLSPFGRARRAKRSF